MGKARKCPPRPRRGAPRAMPGPEHGGLEPPEGRVGCRSGSLAGVSVARAGLVVPGSRGEGAL